MKYMERKKNNGDDDKNDNNNINNNNNNNNYNNTDKSKSGIKISTKRMSILDLPDGNVVSSNYGDLYSTYPLTSSSLSSSSSSSRINGKKNESPPKTSSNLNLENNTAVRNNDLIRTSQRNVDIYNFLKLIVYDEAGGVNNIQQREGRLK